MTGTERRMELLRLIKESKEPVKGSELSRKLGVSRQVIVQDIALLRAKKHNIIGTTMGYICQ